jgi:hypothetical protein
LWPRYAGLGTCRSYRDAGIPEHWNAAGTPNVINIRKQEIRTLKSITIEFTAQPILPIIGVSLNNIYIYVYIYYSIYHFIFSALP